MTPLLALILAIQAQDLHGDPLPQDAQVRLGRVEFRHARWIYAMSLSADDKTLATGGPDSSIRIWEPLTGRLRRLIDTGWILNAELTPDGKIVASVSSHQGRIRFHEVETGRELGHSIEIKDVSYMDISPDGTLIAATGPVAEVRVWRIATGELVHDLKGVTGRATGVAFADNGRKLVAGSTDKELRVWVSRRVRKPERWPTIASP